MENQKEMPKLEITQAYYKLKKILQNETSKKLFITSWLSPNTINVMKYIRRQWLIIQENVHNPDNFFYILKS